MRQERTASEPDDRSAEDAHAARGDDAPSGGVQVIARAAEILRELRVSSDGRGLTVSEVARRVDLARSTVHRIIAALEAEELVAQAPAPGRFTIGPGIGRLAEHARTRLRADVAPFLRRLSAESGETVDLAVLENSQVLFIDQAVGRRRLLAVSAIGASFPAHCTANGKAMLAALDDQRVIDLLPARLQRFTEHTIIRRVDLLANLGEVRAVGVAFDREEHTLGVAAVGSVIKDATGAVAAITIPAPAERFHEREHELTQMLRLTCAETSAALGAIPTA
ncbi:MAG: IclR family transcriptional regulator [Solirubrobacterales bacterium]|nr:IclR family transcriptional regulator [Solirubrobacterales bacterium]